MPTETMNVDQQVLPGNLPGLQLESVSADSRQQVFYYYHRADSATGVAPVLVCVHGILRRPDEIAQAFLPLARATGCSLVVPYFGEAWFPDYQRLGVKGPGLRADQALDAILNKVLAEESDQKQAQGQTLLFGYSGGAQFAHRYALLHPEKVDRMALAAAGWYTFPHYQEPFPFGLLSETKRADMTYDLLGSLKIASLVMVGELDCERDCTLRASPRVDARQGFNRLERAQRWVRATRAAARYYKLEQRCEFAVLPGSGHSFAECCERGGMIEKTMEFFFPQRAVEIGYHKEPVDL